MNRTSHFANSRYEHIFKKWFIFFHVNNDSFVGDKACVKSPSNSLLNRFFDNSIIYFEESSINEKQCQHFGDASMTPQISDDPLGERPICLDSEELNFQKAFGLFL